MDLDPILRLKTAEIDGYLGDYFGRIRYPEYYPEELREAMSYSLFSGGKRLRPALVLLVGEAFGEDTAPLLPLAGALELVHTYSLIHDDLPCMDDDELRRGRPTTHVKYGEAIALLAGDALLTEAFRMLCGLAPQAGPRFAGIVSRFSEAAGFLGMVAGQAADLLAEKHVPHRGMLDFIHRHKTGALIEASAVLPAIALGASPGQLDALSRYSRNLGMVFQIVDDILNVTSSAEELGKPVGSDKERGKNTFPGLYGIATAQDMARRLTAEAITALDVFTQERSAVLRMLAEHFLERKK